MYTRSAKSLCKKCYVSWPTGSQYQWSVHVILSLFAIIPQPSLDPTLSRDNQYIYTLWNRISGNLQTMPQYTSPINTQSLIWGETLELWVCYHIIIYFIFWNMQTHTHWEGVNLLSFQRTRSKLNKSILVCPCAHDDLRSETLVRLHWCMNSPGGFGLNVSLSTPSPPTEVTPRYWSFLRCFHMEIQLEV